MHIHTQKQSRSALLIAILAVALCWLAACSSDDVETSASADDETASHADGDQEAPSNDETDDSSTDQGDETMDNAFGDLPAPAATTVQGLLDLERPVVIAHASGENAHPNATLFGYTEAVRAGVDALDIDVHLTKDGVLVANHDATIDRTTNGTGRVDELTYDEIAVFDAGYWYTRNCSACTDQPEEDYIYRGVRTGEVAPPAGYSADDFTVARVEDIMNRFPDHVLNFELKGDAETGAGAARELARLLIEHDREDGAVVSSFDEELTAIFHEAAPNVENSPGLAALTDYVLNGTPLPDGQRIAQIPPAYEGIEVLTPALVEKATADGLYLWIWPNNRELENTAGYEWLLEMGVHGINSADPAVAVAAVQAHITDAN